jgi:hypothetical protein
MRLKTLVCYHLVQLLVVTTGGRTASGNARTLMTIMRIHLAMTTLLESISTGTNAYANAKTARRKTGQVSHRIRAAHGEISEKTAGNAPLLPELLA